jgi:hypothetical protein
VRLFVGCATDEIKEKRNTSGSYWGEEGGQERKNRKRKGSNTWRLGQEWTRHKIEDLCLGIRVR